MYGKNIAGDAEQHVFDESSERKLFGHDAEGCEVTHLQIIAVYKQQQGNANEGEEFEFLRQVSMHRKPPRPPKGDLAVAQGPLLHESLLLVAFLIA